LIVYFLSVGGTVDVNDLNDESDVSDEEEQQVIEF
jgi:hypothetical protein